MSITMHGTEFEPLIVRHHHYNVDDFSELSHGDGFRYEIIDGALVVTGSPKMRHQRAVLRLALLLDNACPAHYEVFVAPFAVVLSDDSVLQPDVLVARKADLIESELPAAPVLAVEVLSPSTRKIDLELKRDRFERAGTGSYWLVDPSEEPQKARLMGWDLIDARYQQVAEVAGDEPYHATLPYPLTVVPAALVS